MKEFEIIELPNGIRVIFKQVSYSKIVHCGYVVDTGTRDELEDEHGIAHFWEHMAFKGTKKRSAFKVLSSLEIFGGELNAYTTKEKMWFHASVPSHHTEKAFDVLTDIVFHSVFPERELEVERGVVLEEISMYLDTPEEYVQDEFEHRLFKNQALGNYILGTPQSVNSFSSRKIKKFVKETVDTDRIVFSIVGNLTLTEVKKLVDRYIRTIPSQKAIRKRSKKKMKQTPFHLEETRHNAQAHCIIGGKAYSLNDEKRLPLFMLSNWLAGPGLTSKLNMVLREKKGYVYTIESNYQPFIDTGMLNFYFGTDKKRVKQSVELIQKEFGALREKKMSSLQLKQMKDQVLGQMLMAEESLSNLMQMMGRSLLDYGRVESFTEVEEKVQQVDGHLIQEISRDVLREDQLSHLFLFPTN